MELTDASRIANEGPVLELKDGRKLRLHFGYGGLRQIEKKFGSLQGLVESLQDGASGEFFDAVFTGLWCGLWKSGITEAELEEQLDPSDIEQHGQILSEALMLAFPKQAQQMAKAAEQNGSQSPSTGPDASISPQSYVGTTATTSGS
jgi:hypothetical protein